MIKHKLTVKKVERAKPGRHGDGGGLYLDVGENSASWYFRFNGRMLGLGSLRDIDLDRARELARDARLLVKAGGDPIAEKRAAKARRKAEQAKVKTFRQCASDYFNDSVDGWDPRHALQWSTTVLGTFPDGRPAKSGYCEALLDLPVGEIDKAMVLSVVKPHWRSKPETARRVLGRIAVVLDYATAQDLRSGANPADRDVLVRGKLLPQLSKSERKKKQYPSVPHAELPGLWVRLTAIDTSPARALMFAILTATRSTEASEATWDEVNLAKRTWTIPLERMKKGEEEHKVPLSDQAIALLRSLPTEDGNPYLFLSSRPGLPIGRNEMRKVLQKKIGRPEVPHGFRATFSTWASEKTGFGDAVVEQCLAHALPNEVMAAYKRDHGAGYLIGKRTELMARWADFVTTPPAATDDNVAQLRAGAR